MILPRDLPNHVFDAANRIGKLPHFDHTGHAPTRRMKRVRHAGRYILYSAGFSLKRLGEIYGCDHSSVYYSIKVVTSAFDYGADRDLVALTREIADTVRHDGANLNEAYYREKA